MTGYLKSSPMDVSVLFARTCLLIPFGYTFRRPLRLQTIALSLALALSLIFGDSTHFEQQLEPTRPLPPVTDEVASWALCVLVAGFADWYLHGCSTLFGYASCFICLGLSLVQLLLTSRRRSILPHVVGRSSTFFWTFFVLLLLPTTRTWSLPGISQYAEDALIFLRAGFQAVREHHAPSEIVDSDHDGSSQTGPGSSSHEEVAEQHSRTTVPVWTTQILYKRLSGHQIRLLERITPSKAGLHLNLTTYDSLSVTSYTAISYCWGRDLTGTRQVYVNGARVDVSETLFKTLEDACTFCDGLFWLDAIAINLADLIERG
jgi:hypothetical protein